MSFRERGKSIVVSGINFFEGGPLTIMTDVLTALATHYSKTYTIYALVSSSKLYNIPNVEFIEFSKSRKSWLFRLYYEYYYFNKLSRSLKPDYWLSMHDMTPNVKCKNQFVYCHNPAPFFKPKLIDVKYGFTTFLFSLFYKQLYRINIKKNKLVIVQQDWLRKEFKKKFKIDNVLVAHPELKTLKGKNVVTPQKSNKYKTLFYPSFPRSFKNFEIICKAYELLPEIVKSELKIYITIDENLNHYARKLVKKYKKSEGLCFVGLLSKEKVFKYYEQVDGLIFPSRLETWGLPISEFKQFDKPILLADLPYAHETIGNYEKALFFNPDSAEELSNILNRFIKDSLTFNKKINKQIEQPFVNNWDELLKVILNE